MNEMGFNVDLLVSDKQVFDKFVYTPLEEALIEIKRRRGDKSVNKYIDSLASQCNIPFDFDDRQHVVLHRQLITPNYEVIRFVGAADALGFEPLFFEYHHDKFVTENEWKYALAHMVFYYGRGKKGGEKVQSVNIIDFNESNGKPLSEINTLWGQPLVEFHHELFAKRFPEVKCKFLDGSEWYKTNGGSAKNYYKPFLSLFLKNFLLFDNFLICNKEISFTRDVFLPAFIQIMNETGLKPLIIALEPAEAESDNFWTYYPALCKQDVDNKVLQFMQR